MAKHVKISLLGFPALTDAYNGDMESHVQKMMNYFTEKFNKVLPDKPDLVVLPEVCDRYPGFSKEQRLNYYNLRGDRIRDFLCDMARKNHFNIAYSASRNIPGDKEHPFRNSTQIIGRDGSIAGIYDKYFLVPIEHDDYGIDYGNDAKVIQTDIGNLACAICFDLNFNELLELYRGQKPELVVFCSQYHGGLKQAQWAYELGCYFAGAIDKNAGYSGILNPYGEVVARTTNYQDYITGKINLDYEIAHIDENSEKFLALKNKYGEGVAIYDPGHVGSVLITCERDDISAYDMLKEFGIRNCRDYLNWARGHRAENVRV